MTSPRNDDVYYFLGNISSHVIHALPLYEQLGGTFVVLSEKAREELRRYDIPVLVIDDRPKEFLKLSWRTRRTMAFLERNAKVVLFYDIFKFARTAPLRKPVKLFLSHGNGLKRFMTMNRMRLRAIRSYDAMAALGPYLKQRFIEDGVDPAMLVDVGIARTDVVVRNRGRVVVSRRLVDQLQIEADKPIVAYVPTYWGATSVDGVGREIVARVPDEFTLIFRPHPQTPAAILDSYRDVLDSRPNVVYAPLGRFDVDLAEILDAAALIIGDVSSVMVEAILLDKPLAFARDALRRDTDDLRPIQALVDFSGEIEVELPDEIPQVIRRSLERGIDPELWEATKRQIFFDYDGTSVASLRRLIEASSR